MRKILTIASREYWAMVATKAFLISIIMMPILFFGGILAMRILNKAEGIKERKILVWDGTGQLYDKLKTAADAAGAVVRMSSSKKNDRKMGLGATEVFLLEKFEKEELTNQDRVDISGKISSNEIHAFLEIPADLIDALPDIKKLMNADDPVDEIPSAVYRSHGSALSPARSFLEHQLTTLIRTKHLSDAGIDAKTVNKINQTTIRIKGVGLFKLNESGEPAKEKENNPLTELFLPFGVMMLMFMVIFLAAQPSLETVLEEKSQKIAEVLLGSANTFQLMIGKLVGVVGGSLTVFSIYIGGLIYFAVQQEYEIPFQILPWFVLFQVLGVFFYGALFMAVGAAVNQLKEAQSMLLPVWMLMMSPMFVWVLIVRDPNNSIGVGMSMFPPATPTTMMLRMATGQPMPLWQPIVGLILMILSTLIVVHIAGRIFRIGILWQGKTPSLKEIFKWAFSSN